MTMTQPQTPRNGTSPRTAAMAFGLCALFAVVAATAQVSATGDTGIDSSGNYLQERAWCMANTAGEAQATCLKNSGAAQAEEMPACQVVHVHYSLVTVSSRFRIRLATVV